LEAHAIHLVHFVPNAVVTLTIFAHACEMFVGVQPSVELFRYFFLLCQAGKASPGPGAAQQARMVGGSDFWIHRARQVEFISLTVYGK
jgi:hypothetical protein